MLRQVPGSTADFEHDFPLPDGFGKKELSILAPIEVIILAALLMVFVKLGEYLFSFGSHNRLRFIIQRIIGSANHPPSETSKCCR